MSLPNIPDITPRVKLEREEVIHLLLTSLAMEEISMSNIMNAEGDKLQRMWEKDDMALEDLLRVNRSVERMLRSIVSKQILLQFKLDNIMELEEDSRDRVWGREGQKEREDSEEPEYDAVDD